MRVTNLSVMGLLSRGGKVTEGKVLFEDRDLLAMTEKELDKIRGDQMTMIFQDPLTSLNPVFTVGNQIMESLQIHRGLSKDEARKQAEELLFTMVLDGQHLQTQICRTKLSSLLSGSVPKICRRNRLILV